MNELEAFGKRMREIRIRAGLSIRDVSLRAGVDKNTVMRLESGKPVRAESNDKICRTYGVLNIAPVHSETFREGGQGYGVFRKGQGNWYRMVVSDGEAPSVISTNEEMQTPTERIRQGRLGFANQFFKRISCDLPGGKLKAATFEVFGKSGFASQPSGEGFFMCLKGSIRVVVDEQEFILEEGDATIFDRRVKHMHEPAPSVQKQDLPCILLYLQID